MAGADRRERDREDGFHETEKNFAFLGNVLVERDIEQIPVVIDLLYGNDMLTAFEAEAVLKELVEHVPDGEERDLVEDELHSFMERTCKILEELGMVEVRFLKRESRECGRIDSREGMWPPWE